MRTRTAQSLVRDKVTFRAARSFAFGGGLLVLGGHDRLFLLDDLAARIWRAIESGLGPSDVIAALVAANPTESDRIRQDVTRLLSQWREGGLFDQTAPADRPATPPTHAGGSAWAATWRCRLGHLVAEIAVESPQQSELLGRRLEHFVTESTDIDARIEVRGSHDADTVVFLNGREYARTNAARNVQRALLGRMWPGHPICALVHGGAVASGDGAACFAGVSGSGKTTLIAHLVSRGLTYLADDLVAVTACGRVLPWPMSMSVKRGSWDTLLDSYPALETASQYEIKGTLARNLNPATDAWRLGPTDIQVIIFPHYLPGGAAQLTRLPPFETLRCLIEAGFLIESPISAERVETVLQWLGALRAYSLRYGDVNEAAENAINLLKEGNESK